jgi:hypothetical protein
VENSTGETRFSIQYRLLSDSDSVMTLPVTDEKNGTIGRALITAEPNIELYRSAIVLI